MPHVASGVRAESGPGAEGASAPRDAGVSLRGVLFATMSSDEFKKGKKITPLH